jgi:hypothetical protein
MNNKSKPVLFTDDTSITVTNSNPTDFKTDASTMFEQVNEWFKFICHQQTFMEQFTYNNSSTTDMNIDYDNQSLILLIQYFSEQSLTTRYHRKVI